MNIKELIGPAFVSELQYRYGTTTVRSLAGKIEGKNVARQYSKYKNGKILPGRRRKALLHDLCPEACKVLRLLLWEFTSQEAPERLHAAVSTFVGTSQEVKSILNQNGGVIILLSPARFEDEILKPLQRMSSLDALYGLLSIYTILNSDIKIHIQNEIIHSHLVANSIISLIQNLVVFTPFYAIRHKLNNLLVHNIFPDNRSFDPNKLECVYSDKTTEQLRELIERTGELGLVGSKLSDQIDLIYWFQKEVHEEVTMTEIRSLCRIIRNTQKTKEIVPENPVYSLLKRMGHWSTKGNLPVKIPKMRRYGDQFHGIASVMGPYRKCIR